MEREMTSETDDLGSQFDTDEDEEARDREDSLDESEWTEHGEATFSEHSTNSNQTLPRKAVIPPAAVRDERVPSITTPAPVLAPPPHRSSLQVMLRFLPPNLLQAMCLQQRLFLSNSWNFWVDGWLRWLFILWSKLVVRFPLLLSIIVLLIFTGLGT